MRNSAACLVRAVPEDLIRTDKGFAKEIKLRSGHFDLKEENSVVLGSELARNLSVRPGDKINLFALSGGEGGIRTPAPVNPA